MRRCKKIGTIFVDAGLCWVGDPCYVIGEDSSNGPKTWGDFCSKLFSKHSEDGQSDHCEPLGRGIGHAVATGVGDGEYAVYIKRKGGDVAAVMVRFL